MVKILHDGTEVSDETPTKMTSAGRFLLSSQEISARRADEAAYFQKKFTERLAAYRDSYIEQEVTHNSKTVVNTKENRIDLATLESRWKAENTKANIKFKNTDKSVADASIADIQGLQKAMFEREQAGRDAEAVILATHAVTPYTDDSWKTDFDTEVAS